MNFKINRLELAELNSSIVNKDSNRNETTYIRRWRFCWSKREKENRGARIGDPRLCEAAIDRGDVRFERRSPSPSADTRVTSETLEIVETLDTAIGCRRARRGWAQVGHRFAGGIQDAIGSEGKRRRKGPALSLSSPFSLQIFSLIPKKQTPSRASFRRGRGGSKKRRGRKEEARGNSPHPFPHRNPVRSPDHGQLGLERRRDSPRSARGEGRVGGRREQSDAAERWMERGPWKGEGEREREHAHTASLVRSLPAAK